MLKMEKKEIKKQLNSLYLQTLSVYPVDIRKQLQDKILEINESID